MDAAAFTAIPALQSRLIQNRFARPGLSDCAGPVIHLEHLTPEHLFVLLTKVRGIFDATEPSRRSLPDSAVVQFMEHCSITLGDAYFRTPRQTVTAFLNLLSVLEQNQGVRWQDLIGRVSTPRRRPKTSHQELDRPRLGMDLPPPDKMTNLPASGSDRPSASFDLLSEPVRRWIWQQGWDELHDIQERSIPILLEGRSDVIIAAPTAAGKTEAAFLPLISRVAGCNQPGISRYFISAPSKLSSTISSAGSTRSASAVELPIHRWHGDVPAAAKIRARKSPAGIVLMTPESLEALLVRRGIEIAALFASVQAIVIDELHAFFGNERGVQLQSLLHRLELAIARRVVRVGLSATLGNPRIAAEFLRPGHGDEVAVLESRETGKTVLLQLRGYQSEERLASRTNCRLGR